MTAQERLAELQLKDRLEAEDNQKHLEEFRVWAGPYLRWKASFFEGVRIKQALRACGLRNHISSETIGDPFVVDELVFYARMLLTRIVMPLILLPITIILLILAPWLLLFITPLSLWGLVRLCKRQNKAGTASGSTAVILALLLSLGAATATFAAHKTVVAVTGVVITGFQDPDLYTFDYVCPHGHTWRGGLRKSPGAGSTWETTVTCSKDHSRFKVVVKGI